MDQEGHASFERVNLHVQLRASLALGLGLLLTRGGPEQQVTAHPGCSGEQTGSTQRPRETGSKKGSEATVPSQLLFPILYPQFEVTGLWRGTERALAVHPYMGPLSASGLQCPVTVRKWSFWATPLTLSWVQTNVPGPRSGDFPTHS